MVQTSQRYRIVVDILTDSDTDSSSSHTDFEESPNVHCSPLPTTLDILELSDSNSQHSSLPTLPPLAPRDVASPCEANEASVQTEALPPPSYSDAVGHVVEPPPYTSIFSSPYQMGDMRVSNRGVRYRLGYVPHPSELTDFSRDSTLDIQGYYLVWVGQSVGIFPNWHIVSRLVTGVPGMGHQRHNTWDLAFDAYTCCYARDPEQQALAQLSNFDI
ncbi:hypothetical protein H0H93_008164 [Arthromyces matolae]|nr:hypothetical protein H0H93_008164 [Arthromyces matolae]